MTGVLGAFWRRIAMLTAVGAVVGGLVSAPGVGAANRQTVKCVGTANSCGATVGIGGGASNRSVVIRLTATNFKLVGVRVIPAASRGAYTITKPSFRNGGSEYRFTLNAVRSNPRGARVILLFAPAPALPNSGLGAVLPNPGLGAKAPTARRNYTADFSVGANMTVSIVGGGHGTSNCTNHEANDTFTTKGDNERHTFGFDSRSNGSCFYQSSWTDVKFTVKDPTGKIIGTGTLWAGQMGADGDYSAVCIGYSHYPLQWKGIYCETVGSQYNRHLVILRVF